MSIVTFVSNASVSMTPMIKIRVNRTIAGVELSKLLDRAEELQEVLRNVGGNSYEDFERVRSDYVRWSRDVQSRLYRIFEEGDVLSTEWQALEIGSIDEDESRLHNITRLASRAACGVLWWKDLQDCLCEVTQSPRTPVPVR
jgi:hypothetical protein